jgi:hypothetical protein
LAEDPFAYLREPWTIRIDCPHASIPCADCRKAAVDGLREAMGIAEQPSAEPDQPLALEARVEALRIQTQGGVLLSMTLWAIDLPADRESEPSGVRPLPDQVWALWLAGPGLNFLGSTAEEVLDAAERAVRRP